MAASATSSLVRLPSIDHGLAPFPEGLLPFRRGSLTDPSAHAYSRPDHQHAHSLQQAHLDDQTGRSRLSANYPEAGPSGHSGYWSSSSLHPVNNSIPGNNADSSVAYQNVRQYAQPGQSSSSTSTGFPKPNFPPQYSSGVKRKSLSGATGDEAYYAAASGSNYPTTSGHGYDSMDANVTKRRSSLASNDDSGSNKSINKSLDNANSRIRGMQLDEVKSDGTERRASPSATAEHKEAYAFPAVSQAGQESLSQPHYQQQQQQQYYDESYSGPVDGGSTSFADYSFGSAKSSLPSNIPAQGQYDQQQQYPRVAISQHGTPDSQSTPLPPGATRFSDPLTVQNVNKAQQIFRPDEFPSSAGSSSNRLKVASAAGSLHKETPYSRSPELKISHKMAERKRRKEMKELFDDLRDSIPTERGVKASKWEILSKSIEFIAKLSEERDEYYRQSMELRGIVQHLEGALAAQGQGPPGTAGGPPPNGMLGVQHAGTSAAMPPPATTPSPVSPHFSVNQYPPHYRGPSNITSQNGASSHWHPQHPGPNPISGSSHHSHSQPYLPSQSQQRLSPTLPHHSLRGGHIRSQSHPHLQGAALYHGEQAPLPVHSSSGAPYPDGEPGSAHGMAYQRPVSHRSHQSGHSARSAHSSHGGPAAQGMVTSPPMRSNPLVSPMSAPHPPAQGMQPPITTNPSNVNNGEDYNPFSHVPPLTSGGAPPGSAAGLLSPHDQVY